METNQATFDPPKVQCDLCASREITRYHQDFRGIDIFKCRHCGVQFMNPQYSDAHLKGYYAHYVNESPDEEEPELYCNNFYLSLVERYADQPGRFLDIGTGAGFMLKAAKARGWEPTGYDVDPATVERISHQIHIPVFSGDFEKIDWPRESFDLVAMHHVLEHLKSPEAYVRRVHAMLKPGGLFLIAVPNIESVSSRLKFMMEKLGLRRARRGAYYDTPHHLWYFSPRPLEAFLARMGFKVLLERSGHQARAKQASWKRFVMRNVTERPVWKSTFLVLAQKQK